ncbi:heparinase II/III family protein [Mucilaginibacter sp. OK098]|uniref:heparinase II/III domain-containing protein n=1 Tax=Mucilaginibacter sp. OK098 TaxID=1855297 RepID=UPI00093321C9|nr:heparinase II/III family protein [Mucilaginibacter sp. OK098]
MNNLKNKLKTYKELFNQFGPRYAAFRLKYEISKKSGLYKSRFPVHFKIKQYIDLDNWRQSYSDKFITPAKEDFDKAGISRSDKLQFQLSKILKGEILFFNFDWKHIGFENDWKEHPVSKYNYPLVHWTKMPIYDKDTGDIKYVWEKSKFSYLLYVLRNDLHNNQDHSSFVFNEIERWIDQNKPNIGPQYICSQEMGIRLINWCFAIFFYKNSPALNQDLLNKILTSIDAQIAHVFTNINFSRIAVRNNHAVTETLSLYLISLYFPFLPNSAKYKIAGKRWFEQEIAYQLFDDGTDSQYSFNYHRVKVQLLSLAISSAKVNDEKLDEKVYRKAEQSLKFLYQQVSNFNTGSLTNFGANDGSIYFKLNDCDYNNYLPQLNALASLLELKLADISSDVEVLEDELWFMQKLRTKQSPQSTLNVKQGMIYYPEGGYVQMRDKLSVSFLKTPELKFRAAQNDLFHVDIWVDGVNLFRDAGSYLYNTTEENSMYFNGVKGHNTVAVNGINHMFKGPRFTWLYKPEHLNTRVTETEEFYEVISVMKLVFPQQYTLQRTMRKFKSGLKWEIEDRLNEKQMTSIEQYWNINPNSHFPTKITSIDVEGNTLTPLITKGHYSGYYGYKQESILQTYISAQGYIKTTITIE